MKKLLVLVVSVFGLSIYSTASLADWSPECSSTGLPTHYNGFRPTPVTVSATTPLYETLAYLPFGTNIGNEIMRCGSHNRVQRNVTTIYDFSGMNKIAGTEYYDVGIQGLGLRIVTPGYDRAEFPRSKDTSEVHDTNDPGGWGGYDVTAWGEGRFEIVKIGDVAAGGLARVPGLISFKIPHNSAPMTRVGNNSPVRVNVTTCSVRLPAPVKLEPITKDELPGVAGQPVLSKVEEFSIELTGCNAKNIAVSVLFEGTYEPGYATVLKSTGADLGVGIQILNKNDNSKPIDFSDPRGVDIGNTGSLPNYSIPLVARYFQVRSDVQGGVVSAAATVTVTLN